MKRYSFGGNLFIAIAVMLIIFSITIAWGTRDILLPRLNAGIDNIGDIFGFKDGDNLLVREDKVTSNSGDTKEYIERLSAEKVRLINSKKDLNDDIERLEFEIYKNKLEIVQLENLILEAELEKEKIELQKELNSALETERELKAEDAGSVEPGHEQEETEVGFNQNADDQAFNEAVDFYVNWLRAKQPIATLNQKTYLCRNLNVSQFLAVRDSTAFREACEITGNQKSEARTDISGPQKSFLCRNRNVAQFLATRSNVPMSEVCGN